MRRNREYIPFNENEMKAQGTYPAKGFNPEIPVLNTPVTPKENLLSLFKGEMPLWIPQFFEIKSFAPTVLPENKVRGIVHDAEPVPKDQFGGDDMFGVNWFYEAEVGGSTVIPGNPVLETLDEWKEKLSMPAPETWAWAESAAKNRVYLAKEYDGSPIRLTIFTGFFERLISWMDFENAAVAMIDEEDEETVHEVFSYLADLYIDMIGRIHNAFPEVDIIQIHDDWGAQKNAFFPVDVISDMIVPHMKKVTDHCHRLGLVTELHSCGKNESLVPAMIEAGIDSWNPQMINDTWELCRAYGDRIVFYVIPENTPKGLSDEEYDRMAGEWVDENIELFKAHPFILMSTPMDPTGKSYVDPKFITGIYKYSRIALAEI